jgi:dTMP kinase
MAIVPFVVGLVAARTVAFGHYVYTVDGTRIVLFVGGLVAAAVGVLAHRQMDEGRPEPLIRDLISALRLADRKVPDESGAAR